MRELSYEAYPDPGGRGLTLCYGSFAGQPHLLHLLSDLTVLPYPINLLPEKRMKISTMCSSPNNSLHTLMKTLRSLYRKWSFYSEDAVLVAQGMNFAQQIKYFVLIL